MPTPTEQKTVQARILAYAEAIGWTIVSREAAEQRRGLKENGLSSPLLGSSNDTGGVGFSQRPPRPAGE